MKHNLKSKDVIHIFYTTSSQLVAETRASETRSRLPKMMSSQQTMNMDCTATMCNASSALVWLLFGWSFVAPDVIEEKSINNVT